MPFGLAQSWFAQSAEVVAVALEPWCSPSFGNARKEGRKKIVEFDSRFLVLKRGKLDCRFTDVLGLRSP